MKIKIEKEIHKFYEEKPDGLFGKWHYFYSSEKGRISLVELKNYWMEGEDLWEIFCLEGGLFSDTEKFATKEEAVEKIKHLLS